MSNISKRWKSLSGQHNWVKLLYPLDNDLRRYLIHYGERAQATYDNFNSEKQSKYAGSSRYAKMNLFSRVGLEKGNLYKYKVVEYIYATSDINLPDAFMLKSLDVNDVWCKDSNFMGYVAVATDEGKRVLGRRDILVAWRGTVEKIEWIKDFDSPLVSASEIVGKVGVANVHKGVLSIYTSSNPNSRCNKTSARSQALNAVRQLVDTYSNETISISITGHSLGGCLSTLNAADIIANGYNKPKDTKKLPCLVTAFIFASPKVGDSNFGDICSSMEHLRVLRIRNAPDAVPHFPPGYTEVGQELVIDSRDSTYLKYPGDAVSWHNLEAAYLHRIAGTQGKNGVFALEVKRNLSLVNKNSGALKDEYMVPVYWWIEKNKGMVQHSDGSWHLEDHEKDDDEVPSSSNV